VKLAFSDRTILPIPDSPGTTVVAERFDSPSFIEILQDQSVVLVLDIE
jgi:hypothetical protein